jgi:hypothetical protein
MVFVKRKEKKRRNVLIVIKLIKILLSSFVVDMPGVLLDGMTLTQSVS